MQSVTYHGGWQHQSVSVWQCRGVFERHDAPRKDGRAATRDHWSSSEKEEEAACRYV